MTDTLVDRIAELRDRWQHHRTWCADGSPRWPWWTKARVKAAAAPVAAVATATAALAVALNAG